MRGGEGAGNELSRCMACDDINSDGGWICYLDSEEKIMAMEFPYTGGPVRVIDVDRCHKPKKKEIKK